RIADRHKDIARCSGRAKNKPPLHADLDRQHPGIDMALARRLAECSLQAQTERRLITARSVLRISGSALANVDARTIDCGVGGGRRAAHGLLRLATKEIADPKKR